MKCPKCGAEVEKGSLYCHKCLTEVPWVPEYNSVETLLHKHAQKKKQDKSQPAEKQKIRVSDYRKRIAAGAALLFLLLLVVTASVAIVRYYNGYDYQYEMAVKRFEAGRFKSCDRHLEKALNAQPKSKDANLLLARMMVAQGDLESAGLVVKPLLKLYGDSPEVYLQYLKILDGEGRTQEIRDVLNACQDQEILDACSEYICREPVFSLEEGTYTQPQTLTITSDYSRIYYTLDGTVPNQNSLKYEGGIYLSEGAAQVSVFCVNEKNVPSNVVTKKYVVVMKEPDPPQVKPEENTFHKKTKVTVRVPDGCTAYYAFDKIPTALSTVYSGPVTLPEGTHTFYVILIGANGKQSELTSRTYTVIYD